MEQSRKNLKFMSIALLILAGLSFARILIELFLRDYNIEGESKTVVMAALIIIAAISFLLLLPQIYCGIKGFNVAKNPDSSKGHIVWAIILLVISIVALVAYIIESIISKNFKENISVMADLLIDVAIYSSFLEYARKVRASAV